MNRKPTPSVSEKSTKTTPEHIAAVLVFLRKLAAEGKATKQSYSDNRPSHLPSTYTLYMAGISFNALMEAAGLNTNRPGGDNRGKWLEGLTEDVAIMQSNRALDVAQGSGLAVVESTLRTEKRQVILPGGGTASVDYEIVSLR
jgi:hypothetical protein